MTRAEELADEPADPWELTTPTATARTASLLSTASHEASTALLPGFLSVLTLAAFAVAAIEGVGHAASGAARIAGGRLGADPRRRPRLSATGHGLIAVGTAALSIAPGVALAGAARVTSWVGRGVRGPLRPAQAALSAPAGGQGRAVGVERVVTHLGSCVGPLLAIVLLVGLPVRAVLAIVAVPALVGTLLALRSVRAVSGPVPATRSHPSAASPQVRRFLVGAGAYELANIATALLLLRATKVTDPDGAGPFDVLQIVAALYVVHHVCAALAAVPAGRLVDRVGPGPVLAVAGGSLLVAYVGFALVEPGLLLALACCFVLSGAAAGAADVAEFGGVARLASAGAMWSAIGVLGSLQSLGRLTATLTAGAVWTLVSPAAGLVITIPVLAVSIGLASTANG